MAALVKMLLAKHMACVYQAAVCVQATRYDGQWAPIAAPSGTEMTDKVRHKVRQGQVNGNR